MASRTELETLNSTLLAVLCEKVAAVSDAPTAAVARALRNEWAALQSPPSTNLKEEREKDEQRLDNRNLMLDFLEGRSEIDWMPKS
jgi:hypothetical protein